MRLFAVWVELPLGIELENGLSGTGLPWLEALLGLAALAAGVAVVAALRAIWRGRFPRAAVVALALSVLCCAAIFVIGG